MLHRGDADGTGRLVAQRAERGNLALDLVEPRPDARSRRSPASVKRDAARRAGQQPKAKPRLQRADGVAQRRLGNAKLGGRLGEAPLARDRDEGERSRSRCPGAFRNPLSKSMPIMPSNPISGAGLSPWTAGSASDGDRGPLGGATMSTLNVNGREHRSTPTPPPPSSGPCATRWA